MQALKAGRFLMLTLMTQLAPTVEEFVIGLSCFPTIKNDDILMAGLQQEFGEYVTLAAEAKCTTGEEAMEWWKAIKVTKKLKFIIQALRIVVACTPTSASIERVFSLLRNTFSAKQSGAYEDYIEVTMMMQYNKRDPL
jgi:hypothetical protein